MISHFTKCEKKKGKSVFTERKESSGANPDGLLSYRQSSRRCESKCCTLLGEVGEKKIRAQILTVGQKGRGARGGNAGIRARTRND